MFNRTATVLSALLVLFAAGLVVHTTSALAHGGGSTTQEVRLEDDCDPATFPAEAQCTGDGDTTFDELVAELLEDGEHGKWRNDPEEVTVRQGDTLTARNIGGEPHSFTEVQAFGGGCVPALNELLGLASVPECGNPAAFPGTMVPPGGTLTTGHLHQGTHTFQCLIHPWMRTTVTVR